MLGIFLVSISMDNNTVAKKYIIETEDKEVGKFKKYIIETEAEEANKKVNDQGYEDYEEVATNDEEDQEVAKES